MKTTNHTPGPWQVSPYGNITSKSLTVAKVEQMPGNYESEKQANAHLISAAPDMLSALQACLDYLLLDSMIEEDAAPEIESICKAIAKAKGDLK
jgi:hypothetical protein